MKISHFSARSFYRWAPPFRGFSLSVLRYFSFERGRYLSSPPKFPPVHHVYIPTYTRLLIIAACMACHLTDSQISLQADWLWLCSLQASVHIYTVTYRVTYRRVCTYYIVGHYRDTTWIRVRLYNKLPHKLIGRSFESYS